MVVDPERSDTHRLPSAYTERIGWTRAAGFGEAAAAAIPFASQSAIATAAAMAPAAAIPLLPDNTWLLSRALCARQCI